MSRIAIIALGLSHAVGAGSCFCARTESLGSPVALGGELSPLGLRGNRLLRTDQANFRMSTRLMRNVMQPSALTEATTDTDLRTSRPRNSIASALAAFRLPLELVEEER